MHRFRSLFVASASLLTLGLPLALPASAQPNSEKSPALTAPQLPSPGTPPSPTVAVPKNTTPPQPSAAQPVLPGAARRGPQPPSSPVVEEELRRQDPLVVRKGASRRAARPALRPRRHARTRYRGAPLERPALAGVELVAPLPPPLEGPHVTVPVPAYPVESVVARFTTPPPPIRCHPTRRDPYAPDPHLTKEVPVQCEPDED